VIDFYPLNKSSATWEILERLQILWQTKPPDLLHDI